MRKLYLFAAMAAMLAACSSDDLTVEKQVAQQQSAEEQAVDFDVYVNRGLTRGGISGPVSTYEITTGTHKAAGFGVFGYYTNGEKYSGITKPNFFYNQQVKYSSGWSYTPIKYWPNEFGSDAISDQVDRVTLFAYLPWVEVDPLTGVTKAADSGATDKEKKEKDPTTNIIGMSRNNVTGDPFVKYVATMDANNSVDLCYAVAAEDFTSSNSSLNPNTIRKGEPYIDVVKPGLGEDGKIKFDFKHATAQLKVTVDAVVNADKATSTDNVETNYTRIWIRSVTFEGITQKGSLNLNDHEWYDMNGTNKITTGSMTLFDGRKDSKEAILAATNETPSSMNADFIQSEAYKFDNSGYISNSATGVTNIAKNLFVGTGDAPVFVIPTNEKMKVTIVYDVETVDKNLAYYLSDGATQGSTIENSISKTIEAFGNITAGYCYTLKLHLGMRTVDFEADVTGWQEMNTDVDLPSNVRTFALVNSGSNLHTISLPAAPANFNFAISGVPANTTVTCGNALGKLTLTAEAANGEGVAVIHATDITANTTTSNIEYSSERIQAGSYYVDLIFALAAKPLELTNLNYTAAASSNPAKLTYDIATGFASGHVGSAVAIKNLGYIKVFRDGVDITSTCTFKNDSHTIELTSANEAAGTGTTIYKVYMKAGDAPEESATKNVTN